MNLEKLTFQQLNEQLLDLIPKSIESETFGGGLYSERCTETHFETLDISQEQKEVDGTVRSCYMLNVTEAAAAVNASIISASARDPEQQQQQEACNHSDDDSTAETSKLDIFLPD